MSPEQVPLWREHSDGDDIHAVIALVCETSDAGHHSPKLLRPRNKVADDAITQSKPPEFLGRFSFWCVWMLPTVLSDLPQAVMIPHA